MTTTSTSKPLPTADKAKEASAPKARRFDFSVSQDEFRALGLVVGLLAVWGGATALFGYPGLILVALALVAALYSVLIIISRG